MTRARIFIVVFMAVAVTVGVMGAVPPILGALTPGFLYDHWTEATVRDLGLPDGAEDVSPIEVREAEGTSPEMATRVFRVAMREDQVRTFYDNRCSDLDMVEPPQDWLGHSPDLICVEDRVNPSGRARTYLNVDCDANSCLVTVEVRL